MVLFSKTVLATIFPALLCNMAVAQSGGWPTRYDFITHGVPVEQAELEELLSRNLAIAGVSIGAAQMGYVGDCGKSPARFIEFDALFGFLVQGTCRFDGSTVCSRTGQSSDEECVEVRRIGELPLLFGEFTAPDEEVDLPEDMRDAPAMVFGIVEGDAEQLAAASGSIVLGPVSLTFPEQPEFTFSYADGFPVTISYISADFSMEGRSALTIQMAGWPDPMLLGHVPDPSIEPESASLVADVQEWGDEYINRPLGTNVMGMDYKREMAEVSTVSTENAACVQVTELITVDSGDEKIEISPKSTLYMRQYCIAPGSGAVALISYSVSDQMLDVAPNAFRLNAASVMDSVRFSLP